jgi:hypothetical protein
LDVVLSQETDALWTLPVSLRWQQGGETVNELVWLEGQEQVFTYCLDTSTSSHLLDPDGLLLLQGIEGREGPDVPVSCIEGVGPEEEEETPGGLFPFGEGSETIRIGGCQSAPGAPAWWAMLSLLPLACRRRSPSLLG